MAKMAAVPTTLLAEGEELLQGAQAAPEQVLVVAAAAIVVDYAVVVAQPQFV